MYKLETKTQYELDFILQLKVQIKQQENEFTLKNNQSIKDLIIKSKL